MYKRIKGKKFSRKTDQRRAFMKSLAVNLVMQEKIRTTKIRARQAASMVEKLITKAKKGDLASRRALVSVLNPAAAEKLVKSIAPRFKDRVGGLLTFVLSASEERSGFVRNKVLIMSTLF